MWNLPLCVCLLTCGCTYFDSLQIEGAMEMSSMTWCWGCSVCNSVWFNIDDCLYNLFSWIIYIWLITCKSLMHPTAVNIKLDRSSNEINYGSCGKMSEWRLPIFGQQSLFIEWPFPAVEAYLLCCDCNAMHTFQSHTNLVPGHKHRMSAFEVSDKKPCWTLNQYIRQL